MLISSKDNQTIKEIKKLKESKYRKEKFIVEGFKMLQEAVNEGADIEIVVVKTGNKELLEIFEADVIEPALLFPKNLDALEIDAVTQNPGLRQINENALRVRLDKNLDVLQVVTQLDVALINKRKFLDGLVDSPVGNVFEKFFRVLVVRVFAIVMVEGCKLRNLADLLFHEFARDARLFCVGVQLLHDKRSRHACSANDEQNYNYFQSGFHTINLCKKDEESSVKMLKM